MMRRSTDSGSAKPGAFGLRSLFLAVLATAALATVSVQAGGPVAVISEGTYATWQQGQVNFIIDNGPLRSGGALTLTRDQGAQLVREVLAAWQDVPNSFVSFEDRGFLSVDVTVSNYQQFTQAVNPSGNPVIFDANGSITNAVFGAGQNQVVLGFATAFLLDGNDDFYDYGFAVLNGLQASVSPNSDFRKTALHEMGHMLGLDHTQAGMDEAFLVSMSPNVPIMFPFIVPSATPATPRRDDEAWVSYLYPEANFATDFGRVRGRVFRRSGGPFSGANIVATPVTINGGTPELADNGFISVVSDFLFTTDGSYELPGLPPGDYAIFVEPIFSAFTGGSGVGPYDFRFENFPRDFYNGAQESGDPEADDPTQMSIVHVNAGQMIEGINFVSNESANDLASLGDDDEELFFFPEGFRFPFFGTAYTNCTVNSDGNITFRGGDSSSSPRDLDRFLDGLPRIAGLFSDLDVTSAGSISAAMEGDALTFRWQGVPEFGAPLSNPNRNTFSITLFESGNIRFHYDGVTLTPDDTNDPLLAIVGVTPGASAAGTAVDFTTTPQPISLNVNAIYQVFGPAAFDLTGVDVFFEAATSQLFLFFPLNESDASSFTGFAVTNDDADTTILSVEALTADGQLQNYPDNPHLEALGGNQQLAKLGIDFFNLPGTTNQDGWVRIGSTGTALASFFQFGSIANGTVNCLDGSTAVLESSSTLYFTRIYDGPGSFPASGGARSAETIIAIANPNDEAIDVSLTLLNSQGNAVGTPVMRQIAANGCLRETVGELFGQGVIASGYIRATASGGGAVGFELVRLSDTLLGFNAVSGNDATLSFSAQLANGVASGSAIFTSIKLVNSSASVRNVTLRALAEDGGALATPAQFVLQPGETLQEDAGVLFALGSSSTAPAVAGSLRVEANGPGIIGDVVFGDPTDIHYAAALPLQTRLLRRAIFSQVANVTGGTAAGSTFTGLAFYNPGASTANIVVTVFRADGTQTGVRNLSLAGGRRISDTVGGLVPASVGQAGGYIVVTSSQPIVAQQLFGNLTLDFLSAVPPTIFN